MFGRLRRPLAGLAIAVTATLASVAMATPAQAAPVPAPITKCSAWVQAAPTGLYLQTCATRDGINTRSKAIVRNFGSTSHYAAELDVKMDLEASYTVCPVNMWIPPATSASCQGSFHLTSFPTAAIGWVYYWTGTQYAWQNANSPIV